MEDRFNGISLNIIFRNKNKIINIIIYYLI